MEIFDKIASLIQEGQPVVLATIVETSGSSPRKPGTKMVVKQDGSILGTLGGGSLEHEITALAREVLASAVPRLVTMDLAGLDENGGGGRVSVFLDPITGDQQLIIIGAGHVGRAVAAAAGIGGFHVILLDDREDVPGADQADVVMTKDLNQVFSDLVVTENTMLVIATRSHDYDLAVLRQALDTPATYIGLLGSKRKKSGFFTTLREEGVSDKTLKRIVTPVGLDIGAGTPGEIAIAIVGQLIEQIRK
ncbi:MAG: dehydrogenase [Desulfobulbaceae bacterium]|nr:dehydrogenase [Desulfobulbaceae bacterium]